MLTKQLSAYDGNRKAKGLVMTLELESFELLYESLKHLDEGFRNLPEFTPKKDYPNLYATLIAERNREWLPIIERYLQTPQNELILVGVGHLVGTDGIIDHLRRSGYRINKLDY